MASTKPRPRILLTGFEPFGGEAINPSWLLAESFHGAVIGGHEVHAVQLPTVFHEAPKRLRAAIKALQPRIVVCLGQAGGRREMSFERVAINVDEARIADNAGQQPEGEPIAKRGPVAYWSTLPLHAMADACEQAGVPAAVSNTAGTFVCNHVFYSLMRSLKSPSHKGVRGGFVHVPFLPEQGSPSLGLDEMRRGLAAALALVSQTDGSAARANRGATH